jgi:hypothetical protein
MDMNDRARQHNPKTELESGIEEFSVRTFFTLSRLSSDFAAPLWRSPFRALILLSRTRTTVPPSLSQAIVVGVQAEALGRDQRRLV